MIIYPAIDIKDGNCVRLKQGKMSEETVYSIEPANQARTWQEKGFQWIHVVDLNGAIDGKPRNVFAVSKIVRTVKTPIQLGGGIRDVTTAEAWIEAGVSRLVLGTVAIEAPQVVTELCKKFPGKIAVGIDAKKGMVATRGWIKKTKVKALDLAKKFEDQGVCAIIYTDIARDGLLEGPNLEETLVMADSVKIPFILSGGVSTVDDVKKIKDSGKIQGVIIGRALYTGGINAADVLKV